MTIDSRIFPDVEEGSGICGYCGASRYEKTKKCANAISSLRIILGAVCSILIILDISSRLNTLLLILQFDWKGFKRSNNLGVKIHHTANEKYYERIYILAGLLFKMCYFVNYSVQNCMGIYVLIGIAEKNYGTLKQWMKITSIFLVFEFLLIPLSLMLPNSNSVTENYEFINWKIQILTLIITISSLLIVWLHIQELEKEQVLALMSLVNGAFKNQCSSATDNRMVQVV